MDQKKLKFYNGYTRMVMRLPTLQPDVLPIRNDVSLTTSQRRRKYTSNGTPSGASMGRLQVPNETPNTVTVVRLHHVSELRCCDALLVGLYYVFRLLCHDLHLVGFHV